MPTHTTTRDQSNDFVTLAEFAAISGAVCPACGSTLLGLSTPECPACREPLVLRVGVAISHPRAFFAGVIGWSIGLGFCIVSSLYGLFSFLNRSFTPPLSDFIPLFVGIVVCGAGLGIWIKHRKFLIRHDLVMRWPLAAGAVLVGLTCPVWFMLWVG